MSLETEIRDINEKLDKLLNQTRSVMKIQEAADYLRVSETTMRRLVRKGEIRSVSVGKKYLVTRSALDEYLERDRLVAQNIVRGIH